MRILLLLVIATACSSQEIADGKLNPIAPRAPAEIRCSLRVESAAWKPGEPAIVYVRLQNLVRRDLNLSLGPMFSLKNTQGEYISYTDIVHSRPVALIEGAQDSEDETRTPIKIHIRGMDSEIFRVDLARGKWGAIQASVLPSLRLESVPPNPYTLKLLIFDSTGGFSVDCGSAEVKLEGNQDLR